VYDSISCRTGNEYGRKQSKLIYKKIMWLPVEFLVRSYVGFIKLTMLRQGLELPRVGLALSTQGHASEEERQTRKSFLCLSDESLDNCKPEQSNGLRKHWHLFPPSPNVYILFFSGSVSFDRTSQPTEKNNGRLGHRDKTCFAERAHCLESFPTILFLHLQRGKEATGFHTTDLTVIKFLFS
jgi:hypothetical protein